MLRGVKHAVWSSFYNFILSFVTIIIFDARFGEAEKRERKVYFTNNKDKKKLIAHL